MANIRESASSIQACLNSLAFAKLLPVVNAGAPTDGTSGTCAGLSNKGTLLIDSTNGKLYINTGTLLSPTWTVVGTQS